MDTIREKEVVSEQKGEIGNMEDMENNIENNIENNEDMVNQEEIPAVILPSEKIAPAIEAILFSMGEAVEKKVLANALCIEEKEVEEVVSSMIALYEAEDRGIQIIQLDNAYQLCTKNEYYNVLTRIVSMPKKHTLTDTLMETLSIIAYKQPITRQEIEAIRGVSCSHAINRLMEYNLVTEVGRLDAVGRPILFGTTEDFLRSFGVSSMDDLPSISPDKIEDFKKEAMEEINVKVEV